MKQCPNRDCVIYTRLDELPDAYTKCPKCGSPLIEADSHTGAIASSSLDTTSPYAPPAAPLRQAALPLYNPYEAEYALPYNEESDGDSEPLRPLPPRRSVSFRSALVGAGGFALVLVCIVLALSVLGRIAPQAPVFNSALATQTAVAWLRPPINTPIILMPTMPAGGYSAPPPAAPSGAQILPTLPPEPPPQGRPTLAASNPPPAQGQAVPVDDALMCVTLERGQPVGVTEAYKPGDPFNLAVKANYGPGGVASVLTRWYGPEGKQIYEMRQAYTQPGPYYAGFTVRKSAAWLPGDYRVDIFTNDTAQPARSVSFSVIP